MEMSDKSSTEIGSEDLLSDPTGSEQRSDAIEDEYPSKLPFRTIPKQQLSTFGESGSSLGSMVKGRIRRKLGELENDRFGSYDYDETGSMKPYLLDLRSMYITELEPVDNFLHITYLDLTYNKLTNEGVASLQYLQNLVTLVLDHNKIKSTRLPTMPHLMYLSLNKNLITEIRRFRQPNLEFLYLNENKIMEIKNVSSRLIPKLNTLSLCNCQLTSMLAKYSQTLEKLYLSHNKIRNIEGLHGLVNLKILHLRNNLISRLTGFSNELSKLYYINLRENDISDGDQLNLLKVLPILRILIITENPLDDELGKKLRQMVLVKMPDMRRINKYLVDDDEEINARRLIKKALKTEMKRPKHLRKKKRAFEGEGEEIKGESKRTVDDEGVGG